MFPLLTLLLWLVWLVGYWRGGLRILQDIRAAESTADRVLLALLSLVTAAQVISAAVQAVSTAAEPPLAPFGLVLVLLGVTGTFYCRRVLGRLWTAQTALQPDHRVVDTGPYAVVRHPIYTMALLLYIGTALVFGSVWISLLAAAAVVLYVVKTANEDAYLTRHLPGYAAYREKVRRRLLPGVW